MKRGSKPIKKVDAILTADWHLRDTQPPCRVDDFEKTQWAKVNEIAELQRRYNCPVIHSGDLFHHWKPSPYLLSRAIELLPKQFHTVYGNHDLPQHNLELQYKSGIYTLERAGALEVLDGAHWEENPTEQHLIDVADCNVLVMHKMVYLAKLPYPDCTDPKAVQVLNKYPFADLIVTGHNHQPFHFTYNGRTLVNPGSITRQESDDMHTPTVYLYRADTNTAEPYHLKHDTAAVQVPVSAEKKQERSERIDSFIARLNTEFDATLSFEKNLERFMQENPQPKEIQQIINESISDE